MKTYRVAVVGLGRMGSTIDMSIANACAQSDRIELVAGADILPERRDAFKETWGVDGIYDDYNEMIAKESPDIVAVCTTATGLPKPGRKSPSLLRSKLRCRPRGRRKPTKNTLLPIRQDVQKCGKRMFRNRK